MSGVETITSGVFVSTEGVTISGVFGGVATSEVLGSLRELRTSGVFGSEGGVTTSGVFALFTSFSKAFELIEVPSVIKELKLIVMRPPSC